MKKCEALLFFLLCLCECGVQGEREWVPTMEQRLTRLEARLSAVVSSMDHEAEADLREYYEKRLDGLAKQNEELQSRLDTSENITQVLQSNMETLKTQIEDCQLVKDNLANLTDSYSQLQSSLDQLKISHNTLRSSLSRPLCESDGFKLDGGVCYYLSTESKSWDESRRFCKARQADLIIINSQEKQDFVNRVVNGNAWLGLTDSKQEGVWKWVDGTPVTSTPTYWSPNYGVQPNGGVGSDCAVHHSGDGWYDYPCTETRPWMCEKVV